MTKTKPSENDFSSVQNAVNQLLEAEKRATLQVSMARKNKADRLKKAQNESSESIAAFKSECEVNLNNLLKQTKENEEIVRSKTNKKLDVSVYEMKSAYEKNNQKLIKSIFDTVFNANPIQHKNYRV
jgi:V-type H+-transporting ATPase subunit G